jgi:tetratricopeptide (TPR) repeat protein
MQAKLSRSLTALAGLIVFSFAASAQTSSMAGKVVGDDGQPVLNALVKIDRTDIKGAYKVKSNKKGEYFHAGLPLGTYTVSIEVNGKTIDQLTVKGVRTRLGDEPTKVDFDLQSLKKKNDSIRAAAETGTLTKEQARDMSPEQKAAMEKALKDQAAAMSKNKALNDAFNAGMQALNAQQYDAAIASFVKASELDPKQAVVWANLAEAYIKGAKAKTGDDRTASMNKGFEAYAKALELKPDDASAHNNFALALADAKKFPEAQAELTKAAQIDPPNAGKYYYNLGALLVNNSQLEPAGEAFKKAIDSDPNYADAYYQLGIYLISKAKITPEGKVTPEAGTKEAFQKYLELKPDGTNAESAKAMLASMDTAISTEYKNPSAPAKKGAATTKKK